MKKVLMSLLLALVMALCLAGYAAAEAFDVTKGGATGVPSNTFGPYTVEYLIDASALNDGDGLTAADTLDCIKIPEGAVVYGVNLEVVTAESGNCTIDVGDSSNATAWLSNQAGNSTSTNAFSLTHGGTAGQEYASGGKIRVTFDHNTDAMKAYLRAVIMPFKND
ncbi:MAG: hypothetical protein EOM03_12020 [Clostridia bacterium]|nr:hypothetical protein [Clostridia bacterium]